MVVIQVRFFVIQRCDAVGNFKSGKMCFQYQPEISTSTELFMISVEIQYAEIPLEVLHISNVYSTEVIFLTLLQMYFIRLFRGIHAQLRAVSFLGTFAFYYCYPVTYVFCPNEYEVDPFCVKLPRPTWFDFLGYLRDSGGGGWTDVHTKGNGRIPCTSFWWYYSGKHRNVLGFPLTVSISLLHLLPTVAALDLYCPQFNN